MDSAKLLAMEINRKFKNYVDTITAVVNTLDDDFDENDNEEIAIMNNLKDSPNRTEFFVEKVVNNYTRQEFQQNFRMQIEAYEFLLQEVTLAYRDHYPNYTSIAIDRQLLAVIWILAKRESYRSIADRFNMAKSSLSWVFFRIVRILNILSPKFIEWPNEDEAKRIETTFKRQNKLKGIIGAIDSTYCPISAPSSQSHCYTNRKKFHSITLQAVCDDRMIFTDCFVGYPSSVHDARILRNSTLYERVSSNIERFFPSNSKILGDKAYPCQKWCITPYKDLDRLTVKQKCFNKAHYSTRQIIERCFALFFGRFRRFHYLEMKQVKNMPATILAGCVLHNVCLRFCEDYNFIEEYIQNGSEQSARNATEHFQSNSHNRSDGQFERNRMADELWNEGLTTRNNYDD